MCNVNAESFALERFRSFPFNKLEGERLTVLSRGAQEY